MSLVLDGVDCTFSDPVDGGSEVFGIEGGDVLELEVGWFLVTEESLVFEVGVG